MSASIARYIFRHGVRVAFCPYFSSYHWLARRKLSPVLSDHAHRFAVREPSGELSAALRDAHLQSGEPVTQLAGTRHLRVNELRL
jgi:hypothetical protein